MIFVNSSNQTLYLFKDNSLIFESKVSTSIHGMGCKMNSFKTPTGLHKVSSMIGKGLLGSVQQSLSELNPVQISTILLKEKGLYDKYKVLPCKEGFFSSNDSDSNAKTYITTITLVICCIITLFTIISLNKK